MIRRRLISRVPFLLFYSCTIFLSYSPVLISAAVVTLDSIEIFKTHEWIPTKPTVFFQCKAENEIVLPDVKEKHVMYSFKGEESWQPLVELQDIKCKRCGLYEKDAIKSDDVFAEWELCASDFTRSDGKYVHFKEKEFNATFLCRECVVLAKASSAASSAAADNSSNAKEEDSNKTLPWPIILVISGVALGLFIGGLVAGCTWWQRRKRQQQQARFLKLFEDEDGEDIDDELGIGPLSHTV
ncbi:valine-tRNA ligase [Perilla frutescens var. frutescens]|nr:valine-tRNA ligase [Perilla frutescens var. frutescens]